MSELRRCKGEYWRHGQHHEFGLGYFHKFGSAYEQFDGGAQAVEFSTAIVELPDGKVVMPMADDITFIDLIKD